MALPASLPSSRPLPPPPPTVSGYVLVRLLQLAHGLPRPVAVDGHLGGGEGECPSSEQKNNVQGQPSGREHSFVDFLLVPLAGPNVLGQSHWHNGNCS